MFINLFNFKNKKLILCLISAICLFTLLLIFTPISTFAETPELNSVNTASPLNTVDPTNNSTPEITKSTKDNAAENKPQTTTKSNNNSKNGIPPGFIELKVRDAPSNSIILDQKLIDGYGSNENAHIVYSVDSKGRLIIKTDSFLPSRGALPNIKKIYDPRYNNNQYITYYKDRYDIDFEKSWLGVSVDEALNGGVDVLFSIQKGIVEIMIYLIDQSYNFKAYDLFGDYIEKTISSIYDSSINIFGSIILACLGFFFSYKMIKKQQADFWGTIVKMVIIISISLFFFNRPGYVLQKTDQAMTNISNTILDFKNITQTKDNSNIPKTKYTENNGSILIANMIWDQYVLKPWQLLEFNDMDLAQKHTDEILLMKPGEERAEKLSKIFDKNYVNTTDISTNRLSFICMYFIPFLINTFFVCLIALIIVGYQFLVLIIYILGAFIMVLALLPNGTQILKTWISKLLGYFMVKVFLTFLFTILIAINEILYKQIDEKSWLAVLLLQLLLYGALYIKRHDLVEIFTSMKRYVLNPIVTYQKIGSKQFGTGIDYSMGRFMRWQNNQFHKNSNRPVNNTYINNNYKEMQRPHDTNVNSSNINSDSTISGSEITPINESISVNLDEHDIPSPEANITGLDSNSYDEILDPKDLNNFVDSNLPNINESNFKRTMNTATLEDSEIIASESVNNNNHPKSKLPNAMDRPSKYNHEIKDNEMTRPEENLDDINNNTN